MIPSTSESAAADHAAEMQGSGRQNSASAHAEGRVAAVPNSTPGDLKSHKQQQRLEKLLEGGSTFSVARSEVADRFEQKGYSRPMANIAAVAKLTWSLGLRPSKKLNTPEQMQAVGVIKSKEEFTAEHQAQKLERGINEAKRKLAEFADEEAAGAPRRPSNFRDSMHLNQSRLGPSSNATQAVPREDSAEEIASLLGKFPLPPHTTRA